MAISATYELIEWATALAFGQGATEFLGTQGDPWDTQSDMFCAMIGALSALVLLSRVALRVMADYNAQLDRGVAVPRFDKTRHPEIPGKLAPGVW